MRSRTKDRSCTSGIDASFVTAFFATCSLCSCSLICRNAIHVRNAAATSRVENGSPHHVNGAIGCRASR